MGRGTQQAARSQRRAHRNAGSGPARDAANAGPCWQVSALGGVTGCFAQCRGRGFGSPCLCQSPFGRLRHAACAGSKPAQHCLDLHPGVFRSGHGGQHGRLVPGFRAAPGVRAPLGGLGGNGAPPARLGALGARPGHRLDPDGGVWFAARTATGQCAGFACDSPRCGPHAGRLAECPGSGLGGLCGFAGERQPGLVAGFDGGGRFHGCLVAVCRHGLAGRDGLAQGLE